MHRLIIIFFIWLLSVYPFAHASAGDTLNTPKLYIEANWDADSLTGVLQFNRVGNLIVLKGRADTSEGNFILDTGAPNLVLNLTYFRDYPITSVGDAEQASITGTTGTLLKTMVREFSLGVFSYDKMEADLVNLGQIENAKGIKILGLLGVELFKKFEMIIDFGSSQIFLHRIDRRSSKPFYNDLLKDTSTYRVLPIELMDNRIITTTTLAGKKLKLIIDCAAESNVIDSRLPDKIFDEIEITRKVILTGAGNRKIDALVGILASLKIGNQSFSNLNVLITNLENTCVSYAGCVDGILGFDFLSLQRVGFNFVNRKMYIWK